MWFPDTNVCIMHSRGHAQVCGRWRQHRASDVAIPLTVYAELLVGAEKSSQSLRVLREIEALLEAHEVIEITEDVAEHYARIRAELETRGAIIGSNTAEFSRVPGLKIEDWSQA